MEARRRIGDRGWPLPAAVVLLSVALATSAGCSETGCAESRKTVTISGSVKDDGFVSGDILVMLAEDISARCEAGHGYSARTPGDTLTESVLAGPGPYSVKGEVRWVEHVPDLDLIIWSRRDDGTCRAGAYRTLPAGDAADVNLVAAEGPCPMRM